MHNIYKQYLFLNALLHLVNKANLVHNLFLVYLSISTCFWQQCAHYQEKQLCLCDTWYLLFCVDDCLVCRVECIPLLRINILRINCAPSWLYLQDYTGKHGQQNIKFCTPTYFDVYTSSYYYFVTSAYVIRAPRGWCINIETCKSALRNRYF